ncbi:MAG: hypothetical protein ACI8V8_002001 [Chitinophagales bacterium]|jgi:hypothetical protein
MEILLELLKYTLPALVVALVVYIMMRTHNENNYKLKLLEMKSLNSKDIVPLKLQAYERLTLFINRVSPEHLIPRVTHPGMTAKQLKIALIQSIQSEFEHNITQQVYVSNRVWGAVVAYKNSFANLVNSLSKQLDDGAVAYDLGKLIVEAYMEDEELMTPQKVNEVIKIEVKTLFI